MGNMNGVLPLLLLLLLMTMTMMNGGELSFRAERVLESVVLGGASARRHVEERSLIGGCRVRQWR